MATQMAFAEIPFEGAKWIGSAASLTPKIDFSSAMWVVGRATTMRFQAEEGKPYELVATAEHPFWVKINGQEVYKWSGSCYDGRFLTHVNLTPFVEKGENEVSFGLIGKPGVTTADLIGIVRSGTTVVAATSAEGSTTARGAAESTAFGRRVEYREEVESPAFARRFSVRAGVTGAKLAITGLGFYEALLDGTKIGDLVLEPAPTDYEKRVLYSTYELGRLTPGEHTLTILLGHGWYDMRSVATWNFGCAPWRNFPRTCARLEIVHADGSTESVVTDGSWDQVESPIVYDCIREGEIVDARRQAGRPYGFKAAEVAPPRGLPEPRRHPGSRVVERLAPERIDDLGGGRCLVTFPQTISGWVACSFEGLSAGDVVTIRYDENVDDDGGPARGTPGNWAASRLRGRRSIDAFFQLSGSARAVPGGSSAQTDHFISAGAAREFFEPRFAYHGFRYVLLEGLKRPLASGAIKACRVMTDFAKTGSFACSDGTLTELVRLTENSYRANFANGVPTDCPHREKLAWTGDGWIASEFGLTYFDTRSSYCKWVRDIVDTQRPAGDICCIAPTSGWGYAWGNGPVFDAALAMVPWNLWLFCGDRSTLEASYPALVRYLAYARTHETASGLVANGLGDWNALNRAHMPSNEYVISGLRLLMLETAAQAAEVLGRNEDTNAFVQEAARSRAALREKYGRGNGVFDNGGQTAQALAVVLGLARDEHEKMLVGSRLEDSVERAGCHIDFGLVGSKFVYRALSAIGRSDLAYRMIVNPTAPSMTKWIGRNGTLWEDLDFGYSKCHIMLGDFAAWALQEVAGIRRPSLPGYEALVIAPTVLPGMAWAKGAVKTPRGEVRTAWKVEDGRFEIDVEIPEGVKAELRLPDGSCRPVVAGTSRFATDWKEK